MMRSILAVVVGLVVAFVGVMAVEMIGTSLYPPPADLDFSNREAMRAFVESLPLAALLIVLAAWFIGCFAGGWAAARLAGRAPLVHALCVGGVILIAAIVNMIWIPHPGWFWIAGIAACPLGALAGGILAKRPHAASN